MQLIKNPSNKLFFDLISNSNEEILLCAPYVKEDTVIKILSNKKENTKLSLITVCYTGNFQSGASDVNAIKLLLENNVKVYNYQQLHAKIYIFDNKQAIITSSNLTPSGLVKNYEYGCLINKDSVVGDIVNDCNKMINNTKVCGEFDFDKIKDIKKIIKSTNKNDVKTDSELDNIIIVDNNSFEHLSLWKKVVIGLIDKVGTIEFTRDDLKQYESYLQNKYPNSKTPMQTVSRILQDLRDIGLIKFYGNGKYKKLWENNDV